MADPITDPTYRYATQRYDLDGSTIDFYFNFSDGYISQDYVRAYYQNLDLTTDEIDRSLITFVGVGHLRIPDAALQPTYRKLVIKRWTEKEYPLCDFTDDSLINEANLDKNARQAVHDIAEVIDYLADLNEKWESLNKTVLELLQIINDKLAILEALIALLENLKFTDLKDTPNSLFAGGIPQVNTAGTALVWRTAAEIVAEGGGGGSGGVTRFRELIDVPQSYFGQNRRLVTVDNAGTGLVFKTASQALSDAGVTILPEAPNDGNEYVRKNNAWAPKTNLIGEAPLDGQQYARKSGAWSVVTTGGGGSASKLIDLTDGPGDYPIVGSTTRKDIKFVMAGQNGWNYDNQMFALNTDYDLNANDLLFRNNTFTSFPGSVYNFPQWSGISGAPPSAITMSGVLLDTTLRSQVSKVYAIGENIIVGDERTGSKYRDRITSMGFQASNLIPGSHNISTNSGSGIKKTLVHLNGLSQNSDQIDLTFGADLLGNLSNYQKYISVEELDSGQNANGFKVIEIKGVFKVTVNDPNYEFPPVNIYRVSAFMEWKTENTGVRESLFPLDESWSIIKEGDSSLSSPWLKIGDSDNFFYSGGTPASGLTVAFSGRSDYPCLVNGYLEFTLI